MPTETSTNITSRPTGSALPATPGGRTLLVATDDTPASDPALRLALALADEGVHVEVINVVDTRPMPIPPPLDMAIAFSDAVGGDAFRAGREKDLRQRVSAALNRPVDWPVRVALGTPANAIIRQAKRIHADFILLGLRRHNVVERVAMDETTEHVMRTASCPVLAVAPTLGGLPRRAMVAVDFSQASLEAARAADRLVGPDGTLVLAYVTPTAMSVADEGERVIHELGVTSAFVWFRGELARAPGAPGAPVEQITLARGTTERVAEVLMSYADGASIDVIALGSRRHGRIERWMLGSVTTDIVRKGSRSMLVVPPNDRTSP